MSIEFTTAGGIAAGIGNPGPFIDGNDDVYVIVQDGTALEIWRANGDPFTGGNWAELDSANKPAASTDWKGVWGYQDGTVIHISAMSMSGSAHIIKYFTFNTSDASSNPDTWQLDETVESPGNNPGIQGSLMSTSIATRTSGDSPVIVYSGDPDSVHGVDRNRIDYASRAGTDSWTLHGQVVAGNPTAHQTSGVCGRSLTDTSRIHVFVISWTDDPDECKGKTIDSSNALSTERSLGADFIGNATATSIGQFITLSSGGVETVILPHVRDNAVAVTAINVGRWTEDASGDLAAAATNLHVVDDASNDGVQAQSGLVRVCLALEGTDQVHVVWTRDTGDLIYRDEATDPDAVGDWGTDVAVSSGTAIAASCHVYNRGGTDYLAMVWADGLTEGAVDGVFYEEVTLSAALGEDEQVAAQQQFIGQLPQPSPVAIPY